MYTGLGSRAAEYEGRAVVGEEGPENAEDTEPVFEVVLARKSPDGGGRVRRGDVLLLVGGLTAGEKVSYLLGSVRAKGLGLDWYVGDVGGAILVLRRSGLGVPRRCRWGSCSRGSGVPRRASLKGVRGEMGPGDARRSWRCCGRSEVAAAGETEGLGRVGTGGKAAQM